MDVTPRTDTFDDLLAKIAAFVEVQGSSLIGFLGQIAVADIGPVQRRPFEDSQPIEGFRLAKEGAVSFQISLQCLRLFLGSDPQFLARNQRIVSPNEGENG